MDETIKKSWEAAYLEFREEPMSDYYEHPLVGIMSRKRVQKIIEELETAKGKTILDAGCEAGYVSLKIAELGAHVYAFDIVKEAVQILHGHIKNQNRKNIFAFYGSAHGIFFKENSMDAVVCTEVIEHMPKLDLVFSEFSRVLKPGGKLIITFPNEAFRKLFYPIIALFGINTEVEEEVTLFSHSLPDIIRMCEKKFVVKNVYSLPWFFPLTRFLICEKASI